MYLLQESDLMCKCHMGTDSRTIESRVQILIIENIGVDIYLLQDDNTIKLQ